MVGIVSNLRLRVECYIFANRFFGYLVRLVQPFFSTTTTSSILTPRRTVDAKGHDTEISTKGRHDPCVGIRAVPIGEAMLAIVLADHYLRHRGQTGKG